MDKSQKELIHDLISCEGDFSDFLKLIQLIKRDLKIILNKFMWLKIAKMIVLWLLRGIGGYYVWNYY